MSIESVPRVTYQLCADIFHVSYWARMINFISAVSLSAMATECSDDPALQCHFKGHRDLVTALHFHPNGTQLVSSSLDQTLMLWNFRQHHRAYRWFILGDPFEINQIDNGGYDADYCKGVYTSKRWRVALEGIVPEKSRRLYPYWVHQGLFFCSFIIIWRRMWLNFSRWNSKNFEENILKGRIYL